MSFSKSGCMETHLPLSVVLAGSEYLTDQIVFLSFLFFFCFLGTRLLSVAMQPHPPIHQIVRFRANFPSSPRFSP